MRKLALVACAVATAMFFALGSSISEAQYPTPVGSVTLTSGSTVVGTGGTTTLTCEVRSATGAPIAGATCTFTINVEPGSDASLGSKTETKITDASGRASANLFVGTTPGVVVVEAKSQNLASSVIITVGAPVTSGALQTGGQVAPPPAAPITIAAPSVAAPPAAPLILPPSTGDGGLK